MEEQRLRELLTGAGLMHPDEAWSITPASGGLNTRVFRATRSGDEPGLSIRMFDTPANLEREVAAIEEVAGCPGVPRVRYADAGVLVHDFLAGQPQPLGEVDPGAIRRLCECLACIHGAEHDHYTHWPSAEIHQGARRDLFRERCASLQVPPNAVSADTAGRIAAIIQWLHAQPLATATWSESTFSRLHGDLSFGNILWAGDSVGLIDWEFTRIADPAEELAYLITEQPVDRNRQDLIRISYIDAGGKSDTWERVLPYAVFVALDSALWWIDYLQRHGTDPAGHPEIDKHLDVAERWIR